MYMYIYIYMALDGDENHTDQAGCKAMCLTAFRSDGLFSGDGLIFSRYVPFNLLSQ